MEIKIDLNEIALKYEVSEKERAMQLITTNYGKILEDTKALVAKTYLEIHNSNIDVLDKLHNMKLLQLEKEKAFLILEELKRKASGSTSAAINTTPKPVLRDVNSNVAFAQQTGGRTI